jgi:hypothetical protein
MFYSVFCFYSLNHFLFISPTKFNIFWITCPSTRFRWRRLSGINPLSYVVLRILLTQRSLSSHQRWHFCCIVWSLTGPLYRIRQFVHTSWMSLPAMRPGFCQCRVSFAERSEVFLGFGANWTCNQGRPNVIHQFKNSLCVVSSHHSSSLVLQYVISFFSKQIVGHCP